MTADLADMEHYRRGQDNRFFTPSLFRVAIRKTGARLIFLPPYSPDLNPIEQVFAKLKALLRKAEARTEDSVINVIAQVFGTFTQAECANYLRHAGYASS